MRKSKYYYFINTEERTKPELSVKSIIEQSQGQLTWKAGLLWLRLIVTNLLSDCHTKNKVLRYPTNQTEWSDWSNTMMASSIRLLVSACWIQLFKFYFSSNSSQDCNSAAPYLRQISGCPKTKKNALRINFFLLQCVMS